MKMLFARQSHAVAVGVEQADVLEKLRGDFWVALRLFLEFFEVGAQNFQFRPVFGLDVNSSKFFGIMVILPVG